MPTALVTGASGFLGSHICLGLEKNGWNVIALTRGQKHSFLQNIRILDGDILSTDTCNEIKSTHIDVIFHFAAELSASKTSYRRLMEVNAAGTAAMLDCYEGSAANLFVYASSFYLIGHPLSTPVREDHPVAPTNPYHASKYAGEVACLEYSRRTGRPVVAFRITAPYGPGMAPSVLDLFLRRAMKGERLSLYGSGSRRQNFIYVDDIFQACLEVAKASTSISGLFNLGGLESVSMIDLARLACATAGRGCDLIDVNIVPDPQEDYRIEVDIGKIINIIPYLTLTNLRDGVQKYHNFLEKKTSWSGFWN